MQSQTSPPAGLRFGTVAMKDMFVGMKDIPFFGYVRMGNFKEPFSLEELTSDSYVTFMERSLPNETFVGHRRVGIAAYRNSDCPRWHVGYGAFFNAVEEIEKERTNDLQGVDFVGRFAYLPMYANDGRQLLHLGVGVRYADEAEDLVRFRARPEVHETRMNAAFAGTLHQPNVRLIDTGDLVATDYFTANLEGALVMGPASIQSELFATRVADAGQDFYSGYVIGSYFLTGEHRSYKVSTAVFDRITPLENFWIVNTPDGRCLGTGAWEAAMRWSFLDLSGTGDDESGIQHDVTLGVNWYWNPYARMMFNYIHSWNSYSNGDPTGELDILAMRWQVDF